MTETSSHLFVLDPTFFKKRIFLKYILLFVFNLCFLAYGYFQYTEEKDGYLSSAGIILLLIGILFLRNGKKQLDVARQMSFEFNGSILKHFGSNNSCVELDLTQVISLKLDTLLGYPRYLVKTEAGGTHIYLGIQDIEKFISLLEKNSGRKFETLERNKWEFILKTILLFLPSGITYFLQHYTNLKLGEQIFYLILNLNSMFFFHNISEKKFEGGLSNSVARRIIIILFIAFCFQFYKIFS